MNVCLRLLRLLMMTGCVFGAAGAASSASDVPIQGGQHASWRAFASKLRQLKTPAAADGMSAPAPVRILHIGDSHTSGDYFSDAVRRALQAEYGDAGPGWLPAGLPRWGRSALVEMSASEHWKHRYAYIDKTPPLSLGGAAYETQRQWATLSYTLKNPPTVTTPPVSWRLWFRQAPPADALHLYADDAPMANTAPQEGAYASSAGFMYETVLPFMPSKLSMVSTRPQQLELVGMSLDIQTPGVVYDSMGVAGARAASLLSSWGTEVTAQVLRVRPPDLVILAFGTNEAYQSTFDPDTYRSELVTVQQWLQTYAPDAAVLLVAPPDALERVGRCAASARKQCFPAHAPASACGVRSHPHLPLVRQTMQEFAKSRSWAYWDWSKVMGRPCGAWQWQQETPPRYRPDGIHLTSDGYETSGLALYKALRNIEQQLGHY
jgi:lysophospholipase L1-like esterase